MVSLVLFYFGKLFLKGIFETYSFISFLLILILLFFSSVLFPLGYFLSLLSFSMFAFQFASSSCPSISFLSVFLLLFCCCCFIVFFDAVISPIPLLLSLLIKQLVVWITYLALRPSIFFSSFRPPSFPFLRLILFFPCNFLSVFSTFFPIHMFCFLSFPFSLYFSLSILSCFYFFLLCRFFLCFSFVSLLFFCFPLYIYRTWIRTNHFMQGVNWSLQ